MDMGSGPAPTAGPGGLSDAGLDMSNYTVANNFLAEILDDTLLQPFDYAVARAFWYGIVIVIAIAAICNLITRAILHFRLRSAASNRPRPASPSNPLTRTIATITAILREASYPQLTPASSYFGFIRIPPFGTLLLIATYLGFVLGLEFYNVEIPGAQRWQAKGLRAAWLTMTQFPLLLLLAGKNNLVGLVVGVSYERLQVLHRWVARAMLLMATLHGAFQAYGWNKYGVLQLEIQTDSCIPTGFATWILLLWLTFSSVAPIRNWQYEFFVVQHVITFIGFLVAIFYHIPSNALSARIYVWIGIGLFIFDRLVRFVRSVFTNLTPPRATIIPLPGQVTKIRIASPRLKSWTPGAHVFLSIPSLGLGQSHPATIASVPSSHNGDLIFLLRSYRGFTSRLHRAATANEAQTFLTLIDGPYGGTHSDFAAFDTAVLIAGSTGVTFTLSLLLDLAHRAAAAGKKLPLRRVVFIWAIKTASCTSWIADELRTVYEKLHGAGIEMEVQIFVTCDPTFTQQSAGADEGNNGACRCDVDVGGPCCCQAGAHAGKEEEIDFVKSEDTENKMPAEKVEEEVARPVGLDFASFHSGRPDFTPLMWEVLNRAEGETGVAVCGPLGMTSRVRTVVATVSDQRGVHKGTGAEGVYLHSECFGW